MVLQQNHGLQQKQNHGFASAVAMAAVAMVLLNMRPDRLWMYNRRDQSRKGLNCAFIGVEEFVSFVLSEPNFVSNGQIRCPCSREPLHYTEECEIGSAMEERVEAENEEMVDGDHVERVDVNLADPYRTMILEAAGPRCKVHPRYGIIEINRKKHFSKYEPFVLAQQSQQVYFAENASKKRDRADWLVVSKIKSRSVINAPELAYQEDEVSIQNEIDDDDEDPQEEVGEEVEIEIEDDDVNDHEDIVEMDEFNNQDDIEGGFEIDDSSTEDENEDSEDQIDYGMTRGKGKARSTGVDRGGYHKVGRNKSIESVQCPTMEQVPAKQVPIVQPPIEQVPIVQPPIEQVPNVQLSIEQVPIVELPIEQSPVVDRPPSDVAEQDHLESEGPSLTNTQQENAYLQVRSQPRISPDGRTYLEPLRDSYV
ncbi:FK506-binding protein 4-like isoform X2 [Senna tora]|uniref:FK506-binding protein 4-like isoform X2 n=1 Tax=Senna tora TaxID=362788 RepID=A0A834W8B7_9FABA|nr:FK506-binding protein 4-like isoform X2 [Senna tora]